MDAQGSSAPQRWVDEAGAKFATYLDARNELGEAFGYQAIPVGILVAPGGEVKFVKVPFSVASAEDRAAIESFMAGNVPAAGTQKIGEANPEAIVAFAAGVEKYSAGKRTAALREWRDALALDPNNFIIRKQIWAVENPDRFYPRIDFDWQRKVLADERRREGGGDPA